MLNVTRSLLEQAPANLPPKQRSQLELLHTVGRRMSILVNDLLDFSRLREQKLVLQRQPVHLPAIVNGVCDLLNYAIPHTSVPIVNAVPASFPAVMADENRLTQIVYNLLHNAAKFTEHGSIQVAAVVSGDMATVSVTDTGPASIPRRWSASSTPMSKGNRRRSLAADLGSGSPSAANSWLSTGVR